MVNFVNASQTVDRVFDRSTDLKTNQDARFAGAYS